MALQVQPVDSRVILRLEAGVNGEGNPIYTNRSYSRIKTDASDQDVYDIAVILAGLQSLPVVSITRVNQMELVNV